jgi:hypothetical protein
LPDAEDETCSGKGNLHANCGNIFTKILQKSSKHLAVGAWRHTDVP